MQTFCHGGSSRATDVFGKSSYAISVTPDIHSCEYKDILNMLLTKRIQVLCAKIEDVTLSSGILHHVVE
jgi:hypothetical protein